MNNLVRMLFLGLIVSGLLSSSCSRRLTDLIDTSPNNSTQKTSVAAAPAIQNNNQTSSGSTTNTNTSKSTVAQNTSTAYQSPSVVPQPTTNRKNGEKPLTPEQIEEQNKENYQMALDAFRNTDYLAAFYMFRSLSAKGHPSAQNNLAVMYNKGIGIHANQTIAEQLFSSSALNSNINAQVNLGKFYEHGMNGIPNYAKAVKWYKAAADQGEPKAQYYLARMYFNGYGITANRNDAFNLYLSSAKQGEKRAKAALRLQYGLVEIPQ